MSTRDLLIATLQQMALVALFVFSGFLVLVLPVWLLLAYRLLRTNERLRRLTRPFWTGKGVRTHA